MRFSASAICSSVASAASAYTTGERVTIEPMSLMRRKIAEHMVLSRRTSAHVTTFFEIDFTNIARLRDRNKKAFEERNGVKLTFMPFIIKAAIDALRAFPIVNASVDGENIIYKHDINIGMAVALPTMVSRLSRRDNHLVWLHRTFTSTEFDFRGHAHALGDFGLREAGAGAGFDELRDQRELVFERVVFGTHGRVLQPALFDLGKGCQVTSLARWWAIFSALRGVCCVFLTKACST